jgi:hypothetical protein
MRFVLIIGLLICTLLSGCEFITPSTSNALSQTQQIEELQKQTQQLEKQTDALDRLANSVGTLVNQQN